MAAQQEQKRNAVGDALTEFTGVLAATSNVGLSLAASPLKNWKMVALAAVSITVGISTGGIGLAIGGAVAAFAGGKAVIDTGVNATNAAKDAYAAVNKTFRPNKDSARVEMPKQSNAAPENTPEQPARVQMQNGQNSSKPKEEEKIEIVMPNRQPEAETKKQAKTTEIENPDTATPEQVIKAQAAVLENPLDKTLGAAQQNAEGKIVRPVLNVAELLAQTKTNAQGIDAKMDAAMGKDPTEADVMKSLNKFTEVLTGNMQDRGITGNPNKENKETDEYKAYQVRFAQAVQDSMRQAGAYTLQTNVESAGRTFELKTPIAAGKVGRNVGNSANYALNNVEPIFNKQEALMNKAAGLSAIQAQKDFQTDGKFDAKKVAEAVDRGEFGSFKGDDKRIAALYDAAEMVAEQYNKEQAKEQPTAKQGNQDNNELTKAQEQVGPETQEAQNADAEWAILSKKIAENRANA